MVELLGLMGYVEYIREEGGLGSEWGVEWLLRSVGETSSSKLFCGKNRC